MVNFGQHVLTGVPVRFTLNKNLKRDIEEDMLCDRLELTVRVHGVAKGSDIEDIFAFHRQIEHHLHTLSHHCENPASGHSVATLYRDAELIRHDDAYCFRTIAEESAGYISVEVRGRPIHNGRSSDAFINKSMEFVAKYLSDINLRTIYLKTLTDRQERIS